MEDTGAAAAPFDLTGSVAVVTGGNRGIGLGIARALGRAGAAVALWARDVQRSEAAVAKLAEEGIPASFAPCDVTDEEAVAGATAATVARFGRIDACVANAGAGRHHPFLETTLAAWERGLRTNLTGTFLVFREVARHLVAAGRPGALVAVSSCAAVHTAPEMHDYAAAKAGLGGLVRAAAAELAPHGVRCNVLMPGWTSNSRMSPDSVPRALAVDTVASIPAGRWGTPDDIGRAAVFLCDPTFPYHTGTELRVDGGYSVAAPYLAVRRGRALLREVDA